MILRGWVGSVVVVCGGVFELRRVCVLAILFDGTHKQATIAKHSLLRVTGRIPLSEIWVFFARARETGEFSFWMVVRRQ